MIVQQGKNSITNAISVEARAAVWLESRLSEDWNTEQQAALDKWIAESWAHRTAYLRLDAAWTRADRLGALRRPASGEGVADGKAVTGRFKATVSIAIASVVALGAIITSMWPREITTYATTIGAHKTVVLADGSRIELNTNSSLRVADAKSQRIIWLDRGEAFFDVKHDAGRPFVVLIDGRRVTDIGTEFVVRRDGGRLLITVVNGRIRFDPGKRSQSRPVLLTQGDVVTADGSSVSVAEETLQSLSNELGWRRGLLIFDHTTLADAATEFNRYNRDKLVIADQTAAKLMIYGTFPVNDVAAFTRVAREIFGLHVEKLSGENVISR